MKTLSSAKITVLGATIEDRDLAADRFCGFVSHIDPRQLKRLTDEGYLNAALVHVDGLAQYCFWYHLDSCRGFHVNAVVRLLDETTGFENLVEGIEATARHAQAQYVHFNTNVAGLVPLAEKFGYVPGAVCMVKRL